MSIPIHAFKTYYTIVTASYACLQLACNYNYQLQQANFAATWLRADSWCKLL